MADAWRTRFEIVPFDTRYRQALRDICAATAWQGAPAPHIVGDEWVWAEVWTRYFTDREPQHAYLVRERGGTGAVVGYLTGTMNIRDVGRFFPRLLPRIFAHVMRKRLLRRAETRRPLLGMLRSHLRGELELPAWVRDRYPATWHFNLLPPARGGGIGRALFERFVADVREHRVPGIHAQTLSTNEPIARFNRAAGLRMVHTQPLTCFAHAGETSLAVHTWVRDIDGSS